MLKLFRRFQLPMALGSLLVLTGCEGLDPNLLSGIGSIGGIGPFGSLGGGGGGFGSMGGNLRSLTSKPTSAYDVLNKIQAAGAIIATVQRFAALSSMQRQEVETTVTRRYDGYVQREKQSLAPQYAQRKAEVSRKAKVRIAEAKATRPDSARKIEAEAKQEVAKVDLEWEKAARSSVAKNYGTDFAVPVQSADGKAVVAFASVKESGVSVSDSSYQVASASGSLKESSKISHSGKTYAVLK